MSRGKFEQVFGTDSIRNVVFVELSHTDERGTEQWLEVFTKWDGEPGERCTLEIFPPKQSDTYVCDLDDFLRALLAARERLVGPGPLADGESTG